MSTISIFLFKNHQYAGLIVSFYLEFLCGSVFQCYKGFSVLCRFQWDFFHCMIKFILLGIRCLRRVYFDVDYSYIQVKIYNLLNFPLIQHQTVIFGSNASVNHDPIIGCSFWNWMAIKLSNFRSYFKTLSLPT